MPRIDTMEQACFPGWSYKVDTPDGTAYVIIMEDDSGKPIGVSINIGKAGSGVAAWAQATSRVCSLALDHGATITDLINELSSHTTDRLRVVGNGIKIRSGIEGVAYALMQYSAMKHQEEIRRLALDIRPRRLGV